MSTEFYKKTQNESDSAKQLSVRAVRSILLYCQDWDNKQLPRKQRIQSIEAGQILCDSIVRFMRDELPEAEQKLLLTIFTKTSIDLNECNTNAYKSLIANERALIKILELLGE